jgi:hypothetical protein
MTPLGFVPVEDLSVGDLVITRDRGPMAIRWIGFRDISAREMALAPRLTPVDIDAKALGGSGRLTLSQQHRIWLKDPDAIAKARLFADTGLPGHRFAFECGRIRYWHFLVDGHALVCANGVWVETLFPGTDQVSGLSSLQGRALRAALAKQADVDHVRPQLSRAEFAHTMGLLPVLTHSRRNKRRAA